MKKIQLSMVAAAVIDDLNRRDKLAKMNNIPIKIVTIEEDTKLWLFSS